MLLRKFCAILLACCVVSAHAVSNMTLAVLDAQAVLLNNTHAIQARNKLKAQTAAEQEKLDALRDEVSALEARFRKEGGALSEHERHEMQEEAHHLLEEYNELAEQIQSQIENEQNALVKQLEPRMRQVVTALSQERGIDMVLEKNAVYLAVPEQDITQEVIKRLNQQQLEP